MEQIKLKAESSRQSFPKRAVMHKMIVKVPIVEPGLTAGEVDNFLLKQSKEFETINYIYIVDKDRKLIGVLSIHDLFGLRRDEKVENGYQKEPIVTVTPDTTQERAAYLALRHGIKALPVVDENKAFLGVVPSHTILSIIYRETREDIMQLAGIHHSHVVMDNILEIPFITAIKHRLPWLVVGLVGGLLAAQIVDKFETILKANLILAAFIPLIVYMADAVGTQMEAFVIRDFAVFRHLSYRRYFIKQLLIVTAIAVLVSAFLFMGGFIFSKNIYLSAVISAALFFAILSSLLSGLVIPYIFTKLKFDPANASGPVATIIQDILSIIIYFSIASWLL